MTTPASLPSALETHLLQAIRDNGGWIGFDRFMELALYAPGLGYYARGDMQFGVLPSDIAGQTSDFVTAPELSPFFGRALAVQVGEALQYTGTREVWEFGAGSGALAAQLLIALGDWVERYTIVDLSMSLRQRQAETLAAFGGKVRWVDELPAEFRGVVVGNEVLDAMPVRLLVRKGGIWHERGVVGAAAGSAVGAVASAMASPFAWEDQPTDLRPPYELEVDHEYLTEIHPAAEGFLRMLSDRLREGAAFFIDYGFPEREYYHAQRNTGTVMCHRAHRMDSDPLSDAGHKDITAHVNFTGLALAVQEASVGMDVAAGSVASDVGDATSMTCVAGATDAKCAGSTSGTDDAACAGAGFELLGYTTQARFLMNCGLLPMLEQATIPQRAMAQKLIMEHEMGELFKVIAFCRGAPWSAIGFAHGDRTHTL